MRAPRPMGIGRLPGIARSLSERARASQPESGDRCGRYRCRQGRCDRGARPGRAVLGAARGVAAQLGEESRSDSRSAARTGAWCSVTAFAPASSGSAEPFGNIAPDGRAPDAAAPRQPIIDVHADGTDIVVIAELPGVDAAEVAVEVQEGALLIAAPGWRKRLDLPGAVLADKPAPQLQQRYPGSAADARRDGGAP